MPLFILMRGVPRRGRAGSSAPRSRMSKLFATFLGLLLGLRKLRDVHLPASSSVTNWRPRGSGMDSSNGRFQPRSATSAPRRFPVRRHALASIEVAIFLGRPVALIAPRLEIGLGTLRQKHFPCLFEVGAGFVEGSGGAGLTFVFSSIILNWAFGRLSPG
jgi:hypothetical protein